MTTHLATFTGNLFLVLATFILGLVALPLSFVTPRGNGVFFLSKLWSWGLLAASWQRVTVDFAQPLDRRASYILLANHQSMLDIPLIIATVPLQLRFAAKRSLFRIPVFGWAIRAGGLIPVDRGDRKGAQGTFTTARERLTGGRSVLFFPEASRSFDGLLHPFERGGFLLAIKTGLPIVPVGIHGTLAARRRESALTRPGRLTVRYGAPIDPAEFGVRGRRELEAEVRRRIEELAGTTSTDEPIAGT